MKKTDTSIKWIILFVLGLVGIAIGIICILFCAYQNKKIPDDIVDSSAVLNYAAGALTFVGTMFLGFAAWKQNSELKRQQEADFVSNNSCMAFVTSLVMEENEMPWLDFQEPMYAKDTSTNWEDNYFFYCTLSFKYKGRWPVFARIEYVKLFLIDMFEYVIPENYSRIQVSFEEAAIEFVLGVPKDALQRYIGQVKCGNDRGFTTHISFSLITNEYVVTKIKCEVWVEPVFNEKGNLLLTSEAEIGPNTTWICNDLISEADVILKKTYRS